MRISLRFFALLFVLITLSAVPGALPNTANAQTNNELRAQIAVLLVRIQELTTQLNSLKAMEAALPATGSEVIGVGQASVAKTVAQPRTIGVGGSWSSSVLSAAATPVPASASAYSDKFAKYPARVLVPAIGLNAPIEYMGLNNQGEMAVPDGNGSNVGWYKDGTLPGQRGSAVLAAHVYAAFAQIKDAPVGSDIYIVNQDGSRLHFVVSEKRTYDLDALAPELLFSRADDERLNLITCAGRYIPALGTYDQRLVLFATLASA